MYSGKFELILLCKSGPLEGHALSEKEDGGKISMVAKEDSKNNPLSQPGLRVGNNKNFLELVLKYRHAPMQILGLKYFHFRVKGNHKSRNLLHDPRVVRQCLRAPHRSKQNCLTQT